jgi:poly(3-hydroxybutyrate) depolymerase
MSSQPFFGVMLSFAAALTATAGPAAARQLGSYDIRQDRIFVAGLSSGGYMAVQMHVAFSRLFKGAAIYAGGPDGCAQGSLTTALTTCEQDEPPVNLAALESITASWASQGLIDPLDNLKGQPVYLWSGTADATVRQPLVDALQSYYQNFQASVFHYDNDFDAEHGWESPYGRLPCQELASPYVIQCTSADQTASAGVGSATGVSLTGLSLSGLPPPGLSPPGQSSGTAPYDSEKVWLTQWFGNLNAKNEGTLKGGVIPFDQNEFAPGGSAAAISMDQTGYAFVPTECASGQQCGLVLALHGCLQNFATVGWAYIDDAGINEWADTNNIIVLYPQTVATNASNPEGCWDWWGYLNDPDYAQKSGPQMQALSAMVARVAGLEAP